MRARFKVMRALLIFIVLLVSLLAASAAEEGANGGGRGLLVGDLQADDGGAAGESDRAGQSEAEVKKRNSGSGTRYVNAATWWVIRTQRLGRPRRVRTNR